MMSGEVISGRVSAVVKGNQDRFFVDDGETMYIPIDLNDVDEWVCDEDE